MLLNDPQTHWLFDYDLTLYGPEERGVLDSLDRKITRFVQELETPLMPWERANALRRDFCTRYGTTLAGLRAHYGTHPGDFFDFIHEPAELLYPRPAPQLRELLLSLRGPCYIFTNGRRDWVEPGLRAMGINDLFLEIFDIAWFQWDNKPQEGPYAQVEKKLGTEPSRLVFLDDRPENLPPARARGWRTVFVGPVAPGESGVNADLHISTILEISQHLESH